jgi:hypothetical protein
LKPVKSAVLRSEMARKDGKRCNIAPKAEKKKAWSEP